MQHISLNMLMYTENDTGSHIKIRNNNLYYKAHAKHQRALSNKHYFFGNIFSSEIGIHQVRVFRSSLWPGWKLVLKQFPN